MVRLGKAATEYLNDTLEFLRYNGIKNTNYEFYADEDKTPEQCKDIVTKYEWVMIILCVITSLCLILTIGITLRFIYAFRLRKGLFTAFMVLLNFALAGRLVFICSEIYLNRPGH